MKKITTIFKTMLLAVVVLVMAQGCIPTTPTGGNPTPTINPNSQISYKVFNSAIFDTTPTIAQSIDINFDDIKPIQLSFNLSGLIYLTDRQLRFLHDTTTCFLLNGSNQYGLSLNTKINSSSITWSNGVSYYLSPGIFPPARNTPGISELYYFAYILTSKWLIPNGQNGQSFYIAFKSPLISNPSKYAYGWLQLKTTSYYEQNQAYHLSKIELIDGAIETNVGEIYTGYH
jgi:hypothetical protein